MFLDLCYAHMSTVLRQRQAFRHVSHLPRRLRQLRRFYNRRGSWQAFRGQVGVRRVGRGSTQSVRWFRT